MKIKEKKYSFIKVILAVIVIYYALTSLFYIVAKEQLYLRDRQLKENSVEAEIATNEIDKDTQVSQSFMSNMDRIDRYSILLTTFARKNIGTLNVKLYDKTENLVIDEQVIDVASVIDGTFIELQLDTAKTGLRDHILEIELSTSEGTFGNAVAPMYNSNITSQNEQLTINGGVIKGTMCYNVYGKENVWTGPHYWLIVNILAGIIIIYLLYLSYKLYKGKNDILFACYESMLKYKFLIKQLVTRDFKIKYKRSLLGGLWSFINPLLTMSIQYIIFSSIFKTDIEKYPVYLLTGVVLFNFFQEVTGNSLSAIIGNAQLINKVYVPKYIYPLSKTLSSAINLGISILPLLIMCIITKVDFRKSIILIPFILVSFIIFCLGIGFILSAVMVFFRDIQFIWSVITMAWVYATPIFYPESILPDNLKFILDINPIYSFIKFIRIAIIDGISPEPRLYFQCALFSICSFTLGVFVFNKLKDRFIYYI